MAIFDKSDNKYIQEKFEELGYPIYFFDNGNEKRFNTDKSLENTDNRWYVYTEDESLNNQYVSAIKIEGVEKGDKWELYFGNGLQKWELYRAVRNAIKVENGAPTLVSNLNMVLRQLSKGSKYMLDSDVAISEDIFKTQSEFANFENFEDVDAPDYSVILGDNPQVATASRMVDVDKLTDSQLKKAEEKLKLEEKALEESLLAKENGTIETAMWTFDEVDALYNTQITTDDKRAYFIYLQNRNRKKLKGGFSEKYGSSYPAQAVDIIELMKKGALFFDPTAKFGERLQPRVIYESGNIYAKWNSLEKNQDYFIARFGQSIYNLHVEVLEPIWKEVWDSRLKCNTKDDNVRLSMLPISNMASTIKVEQVINPSDREQVEENFRIYTSFRKGEKIEDVADLEYGSSRNNIINKKSLSLKDAFIRWCKMAGSGQRAQEVGVQWSSLTPDLENLMNFYLKPIANPFKNEKGGEDKFARRKDDAMKVGVRLFSQFLQEGLMPKDQWKVEFLFNSVYNSYREPNLEQVPIGFTYKKYIDNRGLFVLRKANLNAIRYFMTRGSIGLAYGVGLGKTFCSIFVMKQALDLGICERPMVIVPNQVYYQFSQEIQRGLGEEFNPKNKGSRLNMFYNGSGIYNELGNNAVDGINLCTYEATQLFAFEPTTLKQQGGEWLENAVNILEMGSDATTQYPDIKEQNQSKHNASIFNIEDDEDLSEQLDEDNDEIDIDTTLLDENDEEIEFEEGGEVDNILSANVDKDKEVIYLNIESTNYDFVCVDEAHNFNNLFEKVVSAPKEIQTSTISKKTGKINVTREINPYSKIRETSGGKESSGRAKKLWWLSQYIQSKSPMGNTLLLSATPFTNSPLQLYSMLAYLNYDMLFDAELGILKDFFDLFAKIEYAEDFKTDLSIVKRNKLVGWRNIIAMQKFVYRVFDKSSREEEDEAVIRPNKIVLPLKRIMIEKEIYNLPKENYVSTTIKLSNKQEELWNRVRQFAKKGADALPYEELCNAEWQNTTILGKYIKKKKSTSDDENTETDVENADDLADGTQEGEKAKDSAKAVLCLMWGRQICLNPYLFKCSGYKGKVTAKQYVEASPKILYIMECIKSIKNFHAKSKKSPYMSGQVIYMNFGIQGFTLIRDYIIEELGFDAKEVGIISGKGNFIGKKKYQNKQMVADAFLGRKFDKEKEKYVPTPHADRVKVLIGSEAIKEGINLQNYASVLYNAFLDFNPTDIVQVEGRIWRQGNEFANVRIVTPLMSDCIDVFMFQKLEDKTERINQIWTKTGNVNELDTTAFNPSELKYELLSDPVQIAFLEVEYKKDQIDEQIVDESSILSRNIGYLSIYNSGEKNKYPINKKLGNGDFYMNMYNNIRILRPDLLDKPLWNREEFDNMLRTIAKVSEKRDFDYLKNDSSYNNPSGWSDNSSYVMDYDSDSPFNWEDNKNISKNPIYREWIGKIYNYSAEELINIMVTLLKEQKIAYPNGYSKNWREVYKPKTEIPIIEYDEVEYDTKKGRKKGIAEYVLNSQGKSTLEKFYYDTKITYRNIDDKSNLDKIIKDNKLKIEFDDDFVNQNNFLDTSEEKKRDIAKLMRIIFKDYPNQIIDSQMLYYKPSKLDIGELEEVSVNDKNITRVIPKDEQDKEIKPLKKPDPFKWGSKDFKENILDIYEYLKMRYKLDRDILSKSEIRMVFDMAKPVEEQITWDIYNRINSFPTIISGKGYAWETYYTFEERQISDTWVDFENKFPLSFGLFYGKTFKVYSNAIPRALAEFRVTQKNVFEPMGISSSNDIQEIINLQQEKINTLKLEKTQLDDKQVFEEIVQEVIRRQEELNSEEIRAGSSYLSRVSNFADSNPDYLGNKMLEVFNNTPISELKEIQKQYRPSDRALAKALEDKKKKDAILGNVEEVEIEEVEVVDEPTKELSSVELLIMDLKETLEFEDNEEVKQKTQQLIDDLEEAMLFA